MNIDKTLTSFPPPIGVEGRLRRESSILLNFKMDPRLPGCVKTITFAITSLKVCSKYSFTTCKLRFLANFCLVLAAFITFSHSLLRGDDEEGRDNTETTHYPF